MSLIKYRRWCAYFGLFLMLNLVSIVFINLPKVQAAEESGITVNAGTAILIEASTGQILYGKNENEPMRPASMSKMMTEYLVLDAVASGEISWDDVVTTRKNAANTLYSGSRIWLAEGDRHTVEELYIAMAIASANDAAVALAEHIAGTQEEFTHRMNAKAREIGLSEHAHFINATGLNRDQMKEEFQPKTIQGETVLTAKDTALIALNLINDHPDVTEFSSIPYHKFRERDADPMVNLNAMLGVWEEYNNNFTKFAYEGADGIKTGYTDEAGYCFTGTAERDGMRLISVVMDTGNEKADMYKRFDETAKLFDYGFNNFEKRTVLSAKSEFPDFETVKITKGVEHNVSLVTDAGIELMLPKTVTDEDFTWITTIVDDDELIAPIEKGQVLGTVKFIYNGPEKIERTINLIATDDVEKAGWFKLLMRSIGNFFSNIFNSIKGIFG